MSTKIYWAYRVKKGRWIEFVDLIHDQMFALVLKHVKEIMKAAKIDGRTLNGKVKKLNIKSKRGKERYRKWMQFRMVMAECKRIADQLERDIFDIDCGINFWMMGRYINVSITRAFE